MVKYPLGKVTMVDRGIAQKGVRQVFPGAEAVGRRNLADATVKALDKVHGSGLVSGDYRSTVTDNSDPHQSPFWIKAVGDHAGGAWTPGPWLAGAPEKIWCPTQAQVVREGV